VSRPRHWTQIDPRVIRDALVVAEAAGKQAAADAAGVNLTTVYDWAAIRRDIPGWPTPDDIADWDAWEAAHARRRAQVNACVKRRTLHRAKLTVPAVGTQRRLRALFALGWSYEDMGSRLGIRKARVSHLVNETPKRGVYLRTRDKVAALYDELSMTIPQGWEHERIRRWAAKRGFAPPLAWDDDRIDDPAARPARGRAKGGTGDYDEAVVCRLVEGAERVRTLTHAEATEAYRRLRRAGRSTTEIDEVYGLKSERYEESKSA
jgi:hypothetical protein